MGSRNARMITVGQTLGLVLAALAPTATGAQIPGFVKQKVKAKVQQEASTALDTALNKATSSVKCVLSDAACIKKAKAAGKAVAVTDASGKPVSSADSAAAIAAATGAPAPGGARQAAAPAPTLKPGEGAWANYDFVPGDRIIFFEDFTNDNVGDFPQRFEFKNGNMEVVEWQGGRYLRVKEDSRFRIPLPEILPERFTVEFDYYFDQGGDVWLAAVPNFGGTSVRFSDPGRLGGG